jgi:thiol-disulfide isomerase/thioredoxin
VLFYSPTCGHCEYVINETLIPMIQKYGDQLQILALDVTQAEGQTFFHAAMQEFGLEQAGVPFLVIGDLYLIGSLDIPEKLPGLVESHLREAWTGRPFPVWPKRWQLPRPRHSQPRRRCSSSEPCCSTGALAVTAKS